MVLLKISDAKKVEYVVLTDDEVDTLQHGFVVYKHCLTHICKESWLPLPEYINKNIIKLDDITLEFMFVSSTTLTALDRVGAFERDSLFKFVNELVKGKTTMDYLRLIYEYIRHNETKENTLYLKALKKSCDHLVW